MTSIADNIARLAAARAAASGAAGAASRLAAAPAPLHNPGALDVYAYVPPGLPSGAPLVVALHGCTQTAAGYDTGTGWSRLADREGFALLLPQQTRANNPNLCFNWFNPGDIARTGGEAESIALMVEAMLTEHALDRAQVFVTGLSAGGAMAAVMLATYPDLFRGGAIIGGLPYGCASDVPAALQQMRGGQRDDDATLAAQVRRAANGHRGPWPSVSLWHGSADATVAASNMERLGRQWRHLHGIEDAVPTIAVESGWEHRAWYGPEGATLVEEWHIAGMGHGVPLDTSGPDRLGAVGPYMLDAGISSTARIAHGWGIAADPGTVRDQPAATDTATSPPLPRIPKPVRLRPLPADPAPAQPNSIGQTIEHALRQAGLMR